MVKGGEQVAKIRNQRNFAMARFLLFSAPLSSGF